MKEKGKENNKNKLWIVIGIILVIIIIGMGVYIVVKNDEDQYDNKDIYNYDSWKNYDEFYKEYSEYNQDFDIGEKNYYKYENDLFSIKYSDKIGEEHFIKKGNNSNSYEVNRNELYVFLTNNTELEVIDTRLGIIYYDKNGEIIDVDSKNIYDLEKSNQICEVIPINSERVEDVKIIINAMENNRKKALIKELKAEITDEEKFIIKVTNESEYNISSINGVVVFYDSENKIIASEDFYIYDTLKKNKSVEKQLMFYDRKEINESKYKIFINEIRL